MGRAWFLRAGVVVLALLLLAPASASAAGNSLLPWPSDAYTRPDKSSPTGRRLALKPAQMPRNAKGVSIAPGPYNASDGFSPGQTIVVRIPGLDTAAAFKKTGLVPQTDLARYADKNQPLVVIDAKTRKRHLVWAELDSNATKDSERVLLVHPGVNWEEGHRYIVALRRLRGANGKPLAAPKGRKPAKSILATLQKARVTSTGLYDAWDFTIASEQGLAGRALSIRDRAYAELGDKTLTDGKVQGKSPAFKVTKVDTFSEAEEPNVARRVEGTFTVPCFLDKPGCPTGAKFKLDKKGLPVRTPGNTYEARFLCNVPRSATAARPARPSMYGHGLFGQLTEIRAENVEQMGNENNVLVCATDWIGMADEDELPAAGLLQDLSKFPTLPDRVQQGYVDFMYLGRLLLHPDGFASDPNFRDGGTSIIDSRELYYYGNSQGGIAGGALTALEPDLRRSALYVGATNYSLLIQRSVDFDPFGAILGASYPDKLQQQVIISLLQILWDRGDPNGYAWHMTDGKGSRLGGRVGSLWPRLAPLELGLVKSTVCTGARTWGTGQYPSSCQFASAG